MELDTKIKIFETGIVNGVFSRNKKFYKPNTSENEIMKLFLEVKENVGKNFNFNGTKIFQAHQKSELNSLDYENGKYIVLNDNHMKKTDYWFEDLPADILILEEKYKGIVVGNQMADCPIIIVEDRKKGVTALSHCGASYIDRLLPKDTVFALQKEYNSDLNDLYVYVGSCAKKEKYVYDKYPGWATNNDLWKDNITLLSDGYHIDMNGAIRKQLVEIGIKNIEESPIDTITNDKFYSHRASQLGDKNKLGQNFVGFFYK